MKPPTWHGAARRALGNLQYYVKDLLPKLSATAQLACFETLRKAWGREELGDRRPPFNTRHATVLWPVSQETAFLNRVILIITGSPIWKDKIIACMPTGSSSILSISHYHKSLLL